MLKNKERWEALAADSHLRDVLASRLAVSPFLASLLVNRGLTGAEECRRFLSPGISDLADPFELPDMHEAAGRLARAIRDGEKILVCGDYDADGITATALLVLFLHRAGVKNVVAHIPNRLEEGYGLHEAPLRAAAADGCTLAISVDCGTDESALVERVRRRDGIDVIITDHHVPEAGHLPMPPGTPLVNPLLGQSEEMNSLSGVGVAFMLARAAALKLENGRELEKHLLENDLDLVAVGSIADLSPQRGQGRVLTRLGLEQLRSGARPAFRELFEKARLNPGKADARAVAFTIGPRLNAAGRMNDARPALDLFLAEETEEIRQKGLELEKNNRDRQRRGRQMFLEACEMVEKASGHREQALVVNGGKKWLKGVGLLGIIAGRLADQYGKPAFALADDGGQLRGSGRTCDGINLLKAVTLCADCLCAFGGHEPAVGLSMEASSLELFREKIARAVAAQKGAGDETGKPLRVESFVGLAEANEEMIREIALLAPFGPENEEPVLASRALEVQKYSRIVGDNHLKLWLREGKLYREGIGFSLGGLKERFSAGDLVDAAYTPRTSSFSRLELEIKALRPHEREP